MAKPQKKKIENAKKTFASQKQTYLPGKIDYRLPSLIAVIAFVLYFNTLHHGYVLDDAIAITQNPLVQKGFDGIGGLLKVDFWHFSNIELGYYRPLALITFAIEHQLFGTAPHISHFINILLYAFTGFMLCLLLMELFSCLVAGAQPKSYYKIFATLVCLLFIAHPAHTEVVANLKSRDEILSFLGIITVLFMMFRFEGSQKKIYLISCLIIYYLAMLSKETAITGVVLLPAILFFFKNKSIADSIKKTIPFVLVVLLFYIQKYSILGSVSERSFFEINNYPYVHEKFTSSMIIFLTCLKLLIFPNPLIYDYGYNEIPAGSWTNPLTLLGFALFAVLIYAGIKGFFQKKMWGFALAVFFVTIIPALAFVWLRGGIMAERFLYAPSLGFSIAMVYFLARLFKLDIPNTKTDKLKTDAANPQSTIRNSKYNSIGLIAIVAVICLAYSFKTVDRNKAWKDNMTLFSTDISNAPNSCQNNRHYGQHLLENAITEKDSVKKMALFNESLIYLHKAVAINHRFGEAWGDLGRAYYDVKLIPDSAILFFRTAIDVTPNAAVDYGNLALVYLTLRKYRLASFYFNMAAAISPSFGDSQRNAAELRKAGIDVRDYPGGEDPSLEYLKLPVLTVPPPRQE